MSRTLRRCPLGVLMLAARETLGLSLRGLAACVDLAPSYVSDLECGRRTPWHATLARICDVLRVPAEARDEWHAAAGLLAPGMLDALLEQPERWPEVRALLSTERGAP